MFEPREDIQPTLGRWAIMLAVLAAGFVPAAYVVVALALAVGGPSESDNDWATLLGKVASCVGLAMALVAFLFAAASRLRREPIDTLWFAFALLPALIAVALLVYFFWVR